MKNHIYVFNAPQVFGGAEVFLVRLAKLLGIGSNYVVVSPVLPSLQIELERACGRFVALPGSGGIAIRLAFLAWLWRHRREIRANTASFILNGRGSAYFAPFVRMITGVSPVTICHTELGTDNVGIKDFLYGAALRFARSSIAVSKTVETQLHQRWPALDVRAIPNWIDESSRTYQSRSTERHFPACQIAVVGRLAENKGIREVAEAFAAMDGIEAHFYGEGPLQNYLDDIASKAPWLCVHGHVDDLASRLPHHTILVSGSYSESFSYSVAEGIYAGLLCVITDIPAHRELLGPDYPEALYFPPRDMEALRKALNAANRLLSELEGQYGREVVQQAHERMKTRNAPEEARNAYRALLLDASSDTFLDPKNI